MWYVPMPWFRSLLSKDRSHSSRKSASIDWIGMQKQGMSRLSRYSKQKGYETVHFSFSVSLAYDSIQHTYHLNVYYLKIQSSNPWLPETFMSSVYSEWYLRSINEQSWLYGLSWNWYLPHSAYIPQRLLYDASNSWLPNYEELITPVYSAEWPGVSIKPFLHKHETRRQRKRRLYTDEIRYEKFKPIIWRSAERNMTFSLQISEYTCRELRTADQMAHIKGKGRLWNPRFTSLAVFVQFNYLIRQRRGCFDSLSCMKLKGLALPKGKRSCRYYDAGSGLPYPRAGRASLAIFLNYTISSHHCLQIRPIWSRESGYIGSSVNICFLYTPESLTWQFRIEKVYLLLRINFLCTMRYSAVPIHITECSIYYRRQVIEAIFRPRKRATPTDYNGTRGRTIRHDRSSLWMRWRMERPTPLTVKNGFQVNWNPAISIKHSGRRSPKLAVSFNEMSKWVWGDVQIRMVIDSTCHDHTWAFGGHHKMNAISLTRRVMRDLHLWNLGHGTSIWTRRHINRPWT